MDNQYILSQLTNENEIAVFKSMRSDMATAKALLKKCRALYNKMSKPSKNYNAYSKFSGAKGTIKTWTSKLNHPELYPGHGMKRGKPKEKDLTREDYKERYEILKKYQAFLKAQRERK